MISSKSSSALALSELVEAVLDVVVLLVVLDDVVPELPHAASETVMEALRITANNFENLQFFAFILFLPPYYFAPFMLKLIFTSISPLQRLT
jgi:hypothetical protein